MYTRSITVLLPVLTFPGGGKHEAHPVSTSCGDVRRAFYFREPPCARDSRFVTKPGFSDNGRWIVSNDPVICLVTIPEGEFSRQCDLQGRSGVAVRTEVSAQSGTADVTPLFALVVFILPESGASLSTLAGSDQRSK